MKTSDKWFLFGIISLGIYLVTRLIDEAKTMWIFPFDFANDHAAHIVKLHFLAKYGFADVPNWFGGFPLLSYYHPGRSFFGLPFYYLFNDAQIATYVAMLVIYLLGFIVIWYIGKTQDFSKIKRIAFFVFFFANPIFIGYLRVGRHAEIFGFFLMMLLFLIIFYYQYKRLDKKFLWFIPVYAALSISHISVFMVSSFLALSLFIIKGIREKIYIALAGITGLALTAVWWIPFMTNRVNTYVGGFYGLQRTLLSSASYNWGDKLASYVVPAIFLIITYVYLKENKKEWKFYSVPIALAILFLTRILAFIPYLNRPVPDTYNLFFLFLTIYMFMKLDIEKLKIKKLICTLLIIIPIIAIIFSALVTPWFIGHTQEDKETIELFNEVDKSLWILESKSYTGPLYSYSAICCNITTPNGYGLESVPNEVREKHKSVLEHYQNKEYEKFLITLKELGAGEIITYRENCDILVNELNLKIKDKKGTSCLITI